MEELPPELLCLLAQHLSLTNIAALCSTSHRLSSLAEAFYTASITTNYPLLTPPVQQSWSWLANLLRRSRLIPVEYRGTTYTTLLLTGETTLADCAQVILSLLQRIVPQVQATAFPPYVVSSTLAAYFPNCYLTRLGDEADWLARWGDKLVVEISPTTGRVVHLSLPLNPLPHSLPIVLSVGREECIYSPSKLLREVLIPPEHTLFEIIVALVLDYCPG
jgi:hypothetical protein